MKWCTIPCRRINVIVNAVVLLFHDVALLSPAVSSDFSHSGVAERVGGQDCGGCTGGCRLVHTGKEQSGISTVAASGK